MQPGDTISFVVMRQTAAGVAASGKVLADFTIRSYKNGVYYDATPTITEIETTGVWTTYILTCVLAASGPYWNHVVIQAASGTDVCSPNQFAGEVEAQDLDSVYAVVSRPTAALSTSSLLSSELQLELVAYREAPLSFNIVDQSGAAIALNGYNNWRFSVWDKTHSGSILYTNAIGLAGSAGGVVTGLIPEDAAFFSQIATGLAASEDFVTLYYDIIADAAATTTKTRTILRGRLILWRYEGAA